VIGFSFSNLNANDLQGLRRAEVFVHVEADLRITDEDLEIYSELLFPVVELAGAMLEWLAEPECDRSNFEFKSMSFDDAGAVRIVQEDRGWRICSIFDPQKWSRPVSTTAIEATIRDFVDRLREECRTSLDIDIAPFLRRSE
jgi:hypothetical protein